MNDSTEVKRFEIIVMLIGVCVTAVLGYGQYRLGQQQNKILENQRISAEERATNDVEIKVMSLVSPHLSSLREPGEKGQNAQRIVLAASEYLSDEYGRTSLAKMAAKITEGGKSVKKQVKVRLEEATQSSAAASNWYSVVSSVDGNDYKTAKRIAIEKQRLSKSLGVKQAVEIYKTKISNNYAIVIGGPLDQTQARSLASIARKAGIASDAFAQKDRSWELVEKLPDAE